MKKLENQKKKLVVFKVKNSNILVYYGKPWVFKIFLILKVM